MYKLCSDPILLGGLIQLEFYFTCGCFIVSLDNKKITSKLLAVVTQELLASGSH